MGPWSIVLDASPGRTIPSSLQAVALALVAERQNPPTTPEAVLRHVGASTRSSPTRRASPRARRRGRQVLAGGEHHRADHEPGEETVNRALHRWPDKAIVAHDANTRGRDLVIGDLHGHFDTLERALEELAFKPSRDRLFSVGDLVDRGPRSEATLEWLTEGRIAAVRGNHEQMMIDTLTTVGGRLTKSGPAGMWADNGGAWWWGLEGEHKTGRIKRGQIHHRRLEQWVKALREVPYLRTVETARGRVGIVHTIAHYHSQWGQIVEMVRALAARDTEMRERFAIHGGDPPNSILWARPEIERGRRDADDLPEALGGIALVLTGHTPGPTPRWICRNVLCIDTGVHVEEYGHLTVAEVQDGLTLHRIART